MLYLNPPLHCILAFSFKMTGGVSVNTPTHTHLNSQLIVFMMAESVLDLNCPILLQPSCCLVVVSVKIESGVRVTTSNCARGVGRIWMLDAVFCEGEQSGLHLVAKHFVSVF